MEDIQLASRRRSAVRSPSPRLHAISIATARIRCAMPGGPHQRICNAVLEEVRYALGTC